MGSQTSSPATTSVTATATATTTPTSVTTITITATATATVAATRPGGPICNNPGTDQPGAGGCSSQCYCDRQVPDTGANTGFCDSSGNAGTVGLDCSLRCASDTDCAVGQACGISNQVSSGCGGPVCLSVTSCSSTLSSKRDAFESVCGGARVWRMERRAVKHAEGGTGRL